MIAAAAMIESLIKLVIYVFLMRFVSFRWSNYISFLRFVFSYSCCLFYFLRH
ncbi:carbohydrate ABC transporter permease [Escherichia phage IMM-001]|nr:carbohydrate ABC transporter permease [Escherichia phage IMM-001]